VVLAFGDGIIDADYGNLQRKGEQTGADAVFTVQKVDDPSSFGVVALNDEGFVTRFIEKPPTNENNLAVVGINWFRSDRQLFDAVDRVMEEGRQTLGEHFMADAYEILLEEGAKIATMEIRLWTDAGQPQNILETNARLLSMGHNTPDAIERSYAEDFMVVPPVYIHPNARRLKTRWYRTLRQYRGGRGRARLHCPQQHCRPGRRARQRQSSTVRSSARNAEVTGRPLQLFVGDNSRVESA
jgi:glucose-1-phosphate thymidylyltransferase